MLKAWAALPSWGSPCPVCALLQRRRQGRGRPAPRQTREPFKEHQPGRCQRPAAHGAPPAPGPRQLKGTAPKHRAAPLQGLLGQGAALLGEAACVCAQCPVSGLCAVLSEQHTAEEQPPAACVGAFLAHGLSWLSLLFIYKPQR